MGHYWNRALVNVRQGSWIQSLDPGSALKPENPPKEGGNDQPGQFHTTFEPIEISFESSYSKWAKLLDVRTSTNRKLESIPLVALDDFFLQEMLGSSKTSTQVWGGGDLTA